MSGAARQRLLAAMAAELRTLGDMTEDVGVAIGSLETLPDTLLVHLQAVDLIAQTQRELSGMLAAIDATAAADLAGDVRLAALRGRLLDALGATA